MGQILSGNGHGEASASIHWCSPLWITDGAAEVFRAREGVEGIDLDPCANPGSLPRVKARLGLYLPRNDGLADNWQHPTNGVDPFSKDMRNAYVNSPFGRYHFNPKTREVLAPKEVEERAVARLIESARVGGSTGIAVTEKVMKAHMAAAKKAVLEGFEPHTIADWVEKCRAEHQTSGMDIIQLGPAAVDTVYWQDNILVNATAVLWIRGRVRFELVDMVTMQVVSVGDPAPMACALSLWTRNWKVLAAFKRVFAEYGRIQVLEAGHILEVAGETL
jgi:hypothetical protein